MTWPEALVLSVAILVALPLFLMVAIAIVIVWAEMAKPERKKKDPRVQ